MTDFIGMEGKLKRLTVQYRAMDIPGTPVFAKGTVTKKYIEDGENIIECDIKLETEEGKVTTPGTAKISLPSR